MIVAMVFHKLKSFFLLIVNIIRRALCCFRRRRRSSCDGVPLTHVGVVSNNTNSTSENWGDWEDDNKPKTIQDHIDLYRKQALIAKQSSKEDVLQEEENLFENMAPRITKQTKLLVSSDTNEAKYSTNRLNFTADAVNIMPGSELGEWEESSGWEGDTLDWDAQQALKEKKRQERERRAWEQQQKRLEKQYRPLGERISS